MRVAAAPLLHYLLILKYCLIIEQVLTNKSPEQMNANRFIIFNQLQEASMWCCANIWNKVLKRVNNQWKKVNVQDNNLKIKCSHRQMAYWMFLPQNSKDYDNEEALKTLLKKFDPRSEKRQGIPGWKRQFLMCNCDVPKSLLTGKQDKEFACIKKASKDYVFKERAVLKPPTPLFSKEDSKELGPFFSTFGPETDTSSHSETKLLATITMKANQEKKPVDFYLYTFNSPCASLHSSCMKNLFLETHKEGQEWNKIGHNLNVGFAQFYTYGGQNENQARDNFCEVRKAFEKEFSEKTITFNIIHKETESKPGKVSDPCP